jgi:myo-inositol-1-phosphate synthase
MGKILDGVADHMKDYPEDQTFVPAKENPVDVVAELKKSGAQILVSYMPVGSQKAVEFYAQAALDAGVALLSVCRYYLFCEKWEKNS